MIQFQTKQSFVIILLFIFSSGCVSKKKHLATIQSMRTTNENVVNDWQEKFNTKRKELNQSKEVNRQLELDLAERKGENNILVGLRNELQLQIESMESQMNNLGSSSKSVENDLRKTVQQKDGEINTLKQKLAAVNTVLDKNKKLLDQISGNLAYEMQTLGINSVEVTTQYDKVVLIFPENILFKKGSSSRITESGNVLLEKTSSILNQYPQMLFQAIGHTDNTPANVKRYKDNWNFSALQAASVVRTLVEDFDISSSQISLAAKGEYEPRASNSSFDGKQMNRRVELVIYRPAEDLAKEIRVAAK